MELSLVFSFIAILSFPAVFSAKSAPAYIKPCHLNKPDFKECALKHGNEAIPLLIKGDKEFQIPPLSPLRVPLIEVKDKTLDIVLEDVYIYGFDTFKLFDISLNREHIDLHFQGNVQIIAKYTVDGQLLVLPIQGQGPFNLTTVGGTYHFSSDLESYQKEGNKHYRLKEPNLTYKLKTVKLQIDNLFNGDKKLGDEINKFMNENWEAVSKDLGKPITEAVTTIITSILGNILKHVNGDEVLLD